MKMAQGEPCWRPRDSPHTPEWCKEVYQKCTGCSVFWCSNSAAPVNL
uniref:Uncharacterized protein n=1 Tax=Arundo donax TaxID=35708 RepID=A0A0A9CHA5_ARUDO